MVLLEGPAAVDDDGLAGDELGLVAAEIDGEGGDLLGGAEAAHGLAGAEVGAGPALASIRASRLGVEIVPGQMALQRTPCLTKSAATDLVRPTTAALLVP